MRWLREKRFAERMCLVGVVGLLSAACAAGGGTKQQDDEAEEDDGLKLPEIPKGDGDPKGSTGEQVGLADVRSTCGPGASKVGRPLLRRLTQGETQTTLIDIFGLSGWGGVKLSPDAASHIGFTNDASVLVVGGNTARELLKTAEDVAQRVASELSTVLPCSATSADRSCVMEYLGKYGKRLFRRPLTEAESTRFADYQQSVASRSDFATGIKWMTVSLIQSPHAFYRSEIGTESAGTYSLDNYEMATELSYMMVGSTPDEALLSKADAGELSDPAVRAAEATRLLTKGQHPRYLDGMRIFFNEWLQYRTVLGQSREDDPTFSEVISPLMVNETRFFLDTLVFGDKGTFADLMTANFTALNGDLAAFYGYGDTASDEWSKVTRPPEYGAGLLVQGSLLASTSHQTRTSPTLRGLMVTERFLCMEPPQVPAVVPTIESTNEGKTANTTREKYELNHAAPGTGCGNCHLQFEPFGYTFEHFDEMGRYRAMEDGFAIDAAVTNAPLPGDTTAPFNDVHEVAQMVMSSTDIQACVSGLMTSYMFSGGGGVNCLSEDDRALAISGEMSIYDYLIGLTRAPHFSSRK